MEAKMKNGITFKKILDSMKEIITDANLDCSASGIVLQAMDSSHVALVNLALHAEGFESYVCKKSMALGVNMNTLAKMLKCIGSNDSLLLTKKENTDIINFILQNKGWFIYSNKMQANRNSRSNSLKSKESRSAYPVFY